MKAGARIAGGVARRLDERTRAPIAREAVKARLMPIDGPASLAAGVVPHPVARAEAPDVARGAQVEAQVDAAIERATDALLDVQAADGHWVFELEADATIPAEYVLLAHYLGEPDAALEGRIAPYLRRIALPAGGWALHHGGSFNMSASIKGYFALKAIGDPIEAPHMRAARDAILAHGGAETANVFTRILLALFGVVTWSAVPVMPVEIMLLPPWFPFSLSRISYWGRTVLVPLLVLQALKPRARNPRGIAIDELFLCDPRQVDRPHRAPHQSRASFAAFAAVDAVLRKVEGSFPKPVRRRALDRAIAFVRERLNGESGLGAIFPAMANTVMMFDALGYPRDDAEYVTAKRAVDRLLVERPDETYCQPCVSPVWDTALAAHALVEVGTDRAVDSAVEGLRWLKSRQVLDVRGDWIVNRANVRPGGWAFQYDNPHYPDLDDTAAVVLVLHRLATADGRATHEFDEAIERATEWIVGMQSRNGGWGAFDADNTNDYLNNIPFADHGALLDPPTSDVSARCVGMLALLDRPEYRDVLERGIAFLLREQEADGGWYGRWGMNYIYGTWSVLAALRAAGVTIDRPEFRRAVAWLTSIQNADGGWGEGTASYELDATGHVPASSTASQTAWAMLALMAAGEAGHGAVARGAAYLLTTQRSDGFWDEPDFTATGFPRVFYLRYHGYPKFFPLWALARYRRLAHAPRLDLRVGL